MKRLFILLIVLTGPFSAWAQLGYLEQISSGNVCQDARGGTVPVESCREILPER